MEYDSQAETAKVKVDGYFRWTIEMDKLMLEVLKEQKLKGQKDDKNFSAEAYRVAIAAINAKFDIQISRTKVVNRLKTLKDQMAYALILLNQKSGFSWNDTTKKIEAEPEVWNNIIESNEKLRLVRDKPLHNLGLLRDIFEKDRATGSAAESAKEKVRRWNSEPLTIDDIDELQVQNQAHFEQFSPFESESVQSTHSAQAQSSNPTSNATSSAKGNKRKAPMAAMVYEGFQDATAALRELSEAILKTHRRVRTEDEIYEAVTTLGLEEDVEMDAYDWLLGHPEFVGGFFALPVSRRATWLARRMAM